MHEVCGGNVDTCVICGCSTYVFLLQWRMCTALLISLFLAIFKNVLYEFSKVRKNVFLRIEQKYCSCLFVSRVRLLSCLLTHQSKNVIGLWSAQPVCRAAGEDCAVSGGSTVDHQASSVLDPHRSTLRKVSGIQIRVRDANLEPNCS